LPDQLRHLLLVLADGCAGWPQAASQAVSGIPNKKARRPGLALAMGAFSSFVLFLCCIAIG
jgi:hypothetical protein